MATLPEPVVIRMVLGNKQAVRALARAYALIDEAACELPWRDDLQRARRLMLRAVRGLRAEVRNNR